MDGFHALISSRHSADGGIPMEQSEVTHEPLTESPASNAQPLIKPVSNGSIVAPPAPPNPGSCPTCGTAGATMPPSYVYALGRIEPRFPRLSVEKEFAQATGRAETVNLTDRQV
jgi:hypothetical protein